MRVAAAEWLLFYLSTAVPCRQHRCRLSSTRTSCSFHYCGCRQLPHQGFFCCVSTATLISDFCSLPWCKWRLHVFSLSLSLIRFCFLSAAILGTSFGWTTAAFTSVSALPFHPALSSPQTTSFPPMGICAKLTLKLRASMGILPFTRVIWLELKSGLMDPKVELRLARSSCAHCTLLHSVFLFMYCTSVPLIGGLWAQRPILGHVPSVSSTVQ